MARRLEGPERSVRRQFFRESRETTTVPSSRNNPPSGETTS